MTAAPSRHPVRLDAEAVGRAAVGRWPGILASLGVPSEALRDRHGPCPGCGGTDRFRFDNKDSRGSFFCSQGGGTPAAGDGFALLQHAHGWGFCETLRAVAGCLGMGDGSEAPARRAPPPAPSKPAPEDDAAQRIERAIQLWRESHPINGTPGERYLLGRRLDPDRLKTDPPGWPETLRYHPDADGRGNGALVVAVNHHDHGLVRAVQRIFVRPDGSPQRDGKGKRKLALAPIGGHAAHLSCWPDPAGWWGLAEGPETALAARQITGVPTWAAISANNLPKVKPPRWARHVVIFADCDESETGITEASKALHAFRALPHVQSARVLSTEVLGTDAADLLREAPGV